VALYSSSGGLKAVIFTDLFQMIIAMLGSFALLYFAVDYVGGFGELSHKLVAFYGENHQFTNFIPSKNSDGSTWTVLSAVLFLTYIITQAFSSSPADGGGYMMQRLSSCRTQREAKLATFLFVFIQYVLRLWPWLIVALCALVVFPIGRESEVLNGSFAYLSSDRESAYPALIKLLLPNGLIGVVVVGLLAAFMSTVDTHLNWGASYIVNDFLIFFTKNSTEKKQVMVGRISVISFAAVGLILSSYIGNVIQAWEWLSIFGASFAAPTLLRWFWWRIWGSS